MLPRNLAQPFQITGGGRNRSRITYDRLKNHARNQLRMRIKHRFHDSQIVIRQRQRMHCGLIRHTRRPRNAKRRHAATSLHQQRVGMAVIAALKLDHKRPPRKPARQPYRRHASLRARAHKPQLLNRREAPLHQLRKIRLVRRARAERSAASGGLTDRRHRRRKRMPQQHRPPGAK